MGRLEYAIGHIFGLDVNDSVFVRYVVFVPDQAYFPGVVITSQKHPCSLRTPINLLSIYTLVRRFLALPLEWREWACM